MYPGPMDRSQLRRAEAYRDPVRRTTALTALLRDADGYRAEVLAARDDAVRAMHQAGHTGTEIMAIIGVTRGRVSQIIKGIR